jgi:hypothetical protein
VNKYFENESAPKVFTDGALTLSFNEDGIKVYVGIHEVRYLDQIKLEIDVLPKLEVTFRKPENKEETLRIDENRRIVKMIKWIKTN